MSIYIHLPVLIVVVSLVYSATRHDPWNKILQEAVHWGLRMTTFLLTIGVVLFVLSTFM
jgi:ABC-type Fe3+ transport system permease subunit